MEWPIDMEWKRCDLIECWTRVVTFNGHLTHDLDLGFSRSNFEKVVSQEWDGRLTWNERVCELIECWTHVVTFNVHLNHDIDLGFSKSNFWIAISRNTRAHRHRMKAISVDRVLYLLCGLQLWAWPWIFKVKFWKCCISGMGSLTGHHSVVFVGSNRSSRCDRLI